ncbi:MAG: N-acetylmuramoyl-L-alanine amidase [Bacteroidia bacterium]|nr:N-acetylmuramoyl-L-alanine amidase [Bacteroidia bacterium]
MKNVKFLVVFLSICFLICGYVVDGQTLDEKHKIKTVVIDAGHGGKDPGAIGYSRKSREKDVALAVALKVGEYIEENIDNVKVVYTRKTDVFIPLHERANIANRNDADVFISIHANCNENHTAYGSETYVLGLHRSEANMQVAKLENSVIELEDNNEDHYEFDVNSPEGHIIMTMTQNGNLEQSIQLANKIQDEFELRAKRKNRGVKQAGFYVLYKTTMPSNLVELGFISNPDEEKYLTSKTGQDHLASAIFRAFRAYKDELDAQLVKAEEFAEVQRTEEKIKDGVYKVQFYASRRQQSEDSEIYSKFHEVEFTVSNGFYRYTTGNFSDLENAKDHLRMVRENGYKDAYLIQIKNGKRLNVNVSLSYKN